MFFHVSQDSIEIGPGFLEKVISKVMLSWEPLRVDPNYLLMMGKR